jgi:hypothetical protein
MLCHGASLGEIGQVPQHRHPDTTSIYAKLSCGACTFRNRNPLQVAANHVNNRLQPSLRMAPPNQTTAEMDIEVVVAFWIVAIVFTVVAYVDVERGFHPCNMTEETIPMRLTWYGHSAFRIEAAAANILSDPFLSDNLSWDKGWIGSRAGEDSTQGGGR